MPCEVNSNADSEFDLRAGGFYTRLVFTLTEKHPFFGIITVILVVVRILLDSNHQLPLVIASMNLVALLMVVYSISKQITTQLLQKAFSSRVPRDIIKREQKVIILRTNCFTYIPLLILYIIYLFFLCSELGNDIISIASLGLSLSDTLISKAIVNLYKE